MLEMRITIEAPELANALNNLAAAIGSTTANPAAMVAPAAPHNPAAMVAPPPPVANPTPAPAPATAAAPSAPAPSNVPLAQPPQFTVDQIMTAGAMLMDAGRVNDLMALLQQFGVVAVTDLKPEQYGAFATALRGMGAKI